jgi:Fe-S-cluster containining protein
MLISETGVPDMYIEVDEWGGRKMAQLEDGWCSALDRNTMKCLIYDKRPWICRDFKMGSKDCVTERAKPIVP